MNSSRLTAVAALVLSAAAFTACSDNSPTGIATSPLSAAAPRTSDVIVGGDPSGIVGVTVNTPSTVVPGAASTYSVAVTGSSTVEPLDVIAVVDASGSIGTADFNNLKTAVKGMADNFTWSTGGNHLGIVEFSTGATLRYSLAATQSATAIDNVVTSMPYTAGSTYTRDGMNAALTEFNANGRVGARRVVLLITDGVPNPATTQSPCNLVSSLAAANVSTLIFGIGADFQTSALKCLVNNATTDITLLSDYSTLTAALNTAIVHVPVAHSVSYTAAIPAGYTVSTPTVDAGTVAVSNNVLTWTLGDLGAVTQNMSFAVTPTATACGNVVMLGSQQIGFSTDAAGSQSDPIADVSATLPSCDTTPPVIAPTITGTQGANGWYTSDVAVHWAVTDPESGVTSSTGCDDVTLSTDSNGTTYTCTATNGAGLNATQTVTVKRDAVTPTVTPTVTGTLAPSGWYTSDVSVVWVTTYGVSGAGVSTGCTPTALTSDTSGQTFTCTTASVAGLTATASVTVKRDASKPTIVFAGNAGTYNLDQTVAITCQATDAGSGINTALTTCPNVNGTSLTLGIGAHTVKATATDVLGNAATASTTYTYVVNCTGIVGLFEQWIAEKSGKPEGTKLMAICTAAAKGNPIAKLIEVAAFAVELNSKAASGLTSDKRQVLLQFIRSL